MTQGQSHLLSLSPPFAIHILTSKQWIANKFHAFDHRKIQLFRTKTFWENLPIFSRRFIWGGYFHSLRFRVRLHTLSERSFNQLDKSRIGKRQGNQRDGQKKIQFEIEALELLVDALSSIASMADSMALANISALRCSPNTSSNKSKASRGNVYVCALVSIL
jgi:hypothetical protein